MSLNIQIYSFIYSFIFGVVFGFCIYFFRKVLFFYKWSIIYSFFYVMFFAVLYFIILLFINNGIIHLYFLFMIILGCFFSLFMLNCVKDK